jgi:hypothetical protein
MPRATYTYPIHPSVSLRLRASAVQVYSIRSMYCKRQVDLSLSRHLDHVKCLKDRFPRSRRDVGCNCPPACLSTRRPSLLIFPPNGASLSAPLCAIFQREPPSPPRPRPCDLDQRQPPHLVFFFQYLHLSLLFFSKRGNTLETIHINTHTG